MNPTPSTQNPTLGVGEAAVYCDCCPHRPKKMAVIQPDAIQIISRRSGRKHIVRIPLNNPLSRSGREPAPYSIRGWCEGV